LVQLTVEIMDYSENLYSDNRLSTVYYVGMCASKSQATVDVR